MNVIYDSDKLRKVVDYVGATQAVLSKVAQRDKALAERAPQVVNALIAQGLLSPHLKEAKVKALIDNPVEILETLEKTAALVVPVSIGTGDVKSASVKSPSADQVFEDRLMR